jgi:hypothetical protein
MANWLGGRETAGDSGDIRRLIYGWNCGGCWLQEAADTRSERR